MHILDYAELSLISSEPVGDHAVTSEKEEHKRRRYWKLSSNFHLKKTTSITLNFNFTTPTYFFNKTGINNGENTPHRLYKFLRKRERDD